MTTMTTELAVPVLPSGAPVKLSWGALFGALFFAMGVFLLLGALGLAVVLSGLGHAGPGALRAASIGIAIWLGIASLAALFVGGMVASRTAGIVDRATGAIHGAVLWGLKTSAVGFVIALASASQSSVASNSNSMGEMGGRGDVTNGGAGAIEAFVHGAAQAGTAMWWVVLSLALGLVAAVAGATVGVTARQRRAAAQVLPREPILAQPVEVHG
jgi:hypothetical protein